MQKSQDQYETMRKATKDGTVDALKVAALRVLLFVVFIAVLIVVFWPAFH